MIWVWQGCSSVTWYPCIPAPIKIHLFLNKEVARSYTNPSQKNPKKKNPVGSPHGHKDSFFTYFWVILSVYWPTIAQMSQMTHLGFSVFPIPTFAQNLPSGTIAKLKGALEWEVKWKVNPLRGYSREGHSTVFVLFCFVFVFVFVFVCFCLFVFVLFCFWVCLFFVLCKALKRGV